MTLAHSSPRTCPSFELLFPSLFDPGRALSFPCDATGKVVLDDLSDRGRTNYLFARAVIGRDFGVPEVIVAAPCAGAPSAVKTSP